MKQALFISYVCASIRTKENEKIGSSRMKELNEKKHGGERIYFTEAEKEYQREKKIF